MQTINRSITNRICQLVVMTSLLGYLQFAGAQQVTLDYLGEIKDADHPAGYRDFVEQGCFQCHGFQGQGGAGPALAPNPIPYEAFTVLVRKPAAVMPAFSPQMLPEDKLKRIYGYLQALPKSPDPDSIPLLSREK